MYLSKKYILASELTAFMQIHIANISMLKKKYDEDGNTSTIKKYGNCLFIDSTDKSLPANIKRGIESYNFTDFSNMLPVTFLQSEFEVSIKILQERNIVQDIITIQGKKFAIINPEFKSKTTGATFYLHDDKDMKESIPYVDGYVMLKKDKCLSWYK
jgi:hypothetical protein